MPFDFHHHSPEKYGIYNLSLFEKPSESIFSVGIHPKDIEVETEKSWKWFEETSQLPQCFAIGECGLDGLINIDENLQENIFQKQILWANTIKKPVIIHCVRRFSQILKFSKIAKTPMIIHGFNKKKEIADQLFNKGFYLSFGKAALQNVSLQEIIKDFPLNRMFLETDAADFDIQILYEKVASLKQISLKQLQSELMENIEKLKVL